MVRGFGRRDALGGRRDAARGSGVSLVLLACSQPRIAAQRAVRARRGRVRPDACGLMLCFPHERGALVLCSAPRCVAESGRRLMCRRCERCLLSNRIERAGVP